jgi:hypothetical protein
LASQNVHIRETITDLSFELSNNTAQEQKKADHPVVKTTLHQGEGYSALLWFLKCSNTLLFNI